MEIRFIHSEMGDSMKKEIRTVVYDEELSLEAYRFQGIVQPFPNHFHEHYVIGYVEDGERELTCRNQEYVIAKGSMVLFNPGDNHACVQCNGGTLDYRGVNISKKGMGHLASEITGKQEIPCFEKNVIEDEEAGVYLRSLHQMVMQGEERFGKEETLLLLISYLIQNYGQYTSDCYTECRQDIEKACEYMERHFAERIYLEQICRHVGSSKSTLLRAFTKAKGVTPYRYLEALRISEAKKLLSEGVAPAEAAMRTGFTDQSHFTNYFSQFIGLSPGVYCKIFAEEKGGAGQNAE